MKIECVLDKITTPINIVSKLASKTVVIPSLQGVLIVAEKGLLTLTATNLDIGIEYKIPVKIEREGRVLVKGEILSKAISAMGSQEKNVTLELVENTLHIKTNNNKITLTTLKLDEFPNIPRIETKKITIEKNILEQGIKSVYFASANTEIKPEIASVYIYNEPGQIHFVATDSFRLAEKKIKTKSNIDISLLIPAKNIQDVLRVVEIMDEKINISHSETILAVESDFIYLTTRVVDGTFPDYKRIIPNEVISTVQVLKQDIQQVLKLTTIFSDTFNQTKLKTETDKNSIEFATKNQLIGEVEHKMPAKISGPDIEMNFNHKYLQEVIGSLPQESITMNFTTSNKAMVIKNTQDDSFLYLVMPLNR